MTTDAGDFLTDLPDPASLSDEELQAQIDERLQAAIAIQQQLTAEGNGFTDRGRAWRARATTARAKLEAEIKVLRGERGRRRDRRQAEQSERRRQHQERMLAESAKRAEQRTTLHLAMQFQATAKRMLPRETYRQILAAARPEATSPPEPATAPAETVGSAPP
jgi:hypothetical protein